MPISALTGKVLLSTLLIFVLALEVTGQSRPTETQTSPITVVTEYWFPFNYLDDSGEVTGTSTLVVRKMLENAGLSYHIDLYPWSRAYQIATTDKNVLIYSIMRTSERENKFQWICPLQPGIPQFVFKLAQRADIQATSLKEARGYKMGLTRGSYTYELITSLGWKEGKDFSSLADTSHFFNLLLKGRVDLHIDTLQGMQQKLSLAGLPPDHTTPLFQLYRADLCIAASLDIERSIIDKLRASLSMINKNKADTAIVK